MTRRIDHLVLAVHDLEAAASWYRRLGFQVGARNHHPWGTDNRLVQFESSFLELITVADAAAIPPHAPRSFSFGAFVRDYLSTRDGLAMLALGSDDAAADAAAFARDGIGDFEPFSFERSGQAADGSTTRVGFTLAFAVDALLPSAAYFTCQQHHPEAFWSTALRRHDNAATNVGAVTLRVDRPGDHAGFLRALTGASPSAGGLTYDLGRGGRILLEKDLGERGLAGFAVTVPDSAALAQRLAAEHIPFRHTSRGIAIGPEDAFGAAIEFVPVAQSRDAAKG